MVDALSIVRVFVNFIAGLLDSFTNIEFSVGSVQLNFLDLLSGMIVMFMLIAVFWKGARV